MAKAFVVSEDAWLQLQRDHQRLRSQLQNLRNSLVAPRHNAGGGGAGKLIEFSLNGELRRGQTVAATHLPWANETRIEDLRVEEREKLSGDVRAPSGTDGYAMKVGRDRYVIIVLDCEKLEPHDGEPQDDDDGEPEE